MGTEGKFHLEDFKITMECLEKQKTKENLNIFLRAINTVSQGMVEDKVYRIEYIESNRDLLKIFRIVLDELRTKYLDDPTVPDKVKSIAYVNIRDWRVTNNIGKWIRELEDENERHHPMAEQLLALSEEYEDIAVGLGILKNKINAMGMRKMDDSKEENPARKEQMKKKTKYGYSRIRMTCPCCLQTISVQPKERMVFKHRYRNTDVSFLIGNCPGEQFKPIEESLDGTYYMIDFIQKEVEKAKKRLEGTKTWKRIRIGNDTYEDGQEEFKTYKEIAEKSIQNDIDGAEKRIQILKKEIKKREKEKTA